MQISRGKLALRKLLTTELQDEAAYCLVDAGISGSRAGVQLFNTADACIKVKKLCPRMDY